MAKKTTKKTTKKTSKGGADLTPRQPPNPGDVGGANPGVYKQDIAREGSKTKGTSIGNIREITAPQLGSSSQIGADTAQMGAAREINGTTIDTGQSNEARAGQMALANQLSATARGEGPSIAEMQLNQATNRNVAQQMAMAASSRGGNPALAARTAAYNAANLGQGAASTAAQGRLAEAISAQNQLGGLLGNVRSTDITGATNQAGLTQAANLANQGAVNQRSAQQAGLNMDVAQLNQAALNQRSAQQGALNLQAQSQNQNAYNAANMTQAQIAAAIQQSQIAGGAQTAAAGEMANASKYGSNLNYLGLLQQLSNQSAGQEEGAGSGQVTQQPTYNNSGGGSPSVPNIGADQGDTTTSDKKAKKNIKPGDKAVEDFMNGLHAATYEYKNKTRNGAGQRMGVMAQDMEKSPVGDSLVSDTPHGKVYDVHKALAVSLAAQADLHHRMKRLESRAH